MKFYKALVAAAVSSFVLSGSALAQDSAKRTYYFAAQFLGHPYLLDVYAGFDHAAEKLGVDIKRVGPQDWNPPAAVQAFEQVLARKPDGIITVMWDSSPKPVVKRAMEQGIPVIVIEANQPDNGAVAFVGLDNYQAGEDAAKQLIQRGGDTGKMVAIGNWGASNTDAKFQGLSDYLAKNSKWTIAGKVEDNVNTNGAIEAAKTVFNSYPDATGIVGLNSSSGSGIVLAVEELGMDVSKMTIIANDREDTVIDGIDSGIIDATIINKTALEAYLAVQLLESFNDEKTGLASVPISKDNKASGTSPFPQNVYMGTSVIDKSNVEYFKR